jgi:tetratricopeptide (TPR) repeat protein
MVNALRSLGYVTGGSKVAVNGVGPDPKSRLGEYQAHERGLEALYDHRASQVVATFQGLLARDSQNTIARYYLGEAYLRLQRREDAVREWKAALRMDPTYAAAAEAIRAVSRSLVAAEASWESAGSPKAMWTRSQTEIPHWK